MNSRGLAYLIILAIVLFVLTRNTTPRSRNAKAIDTMIYKLFDDNDSDLAAAI